MPPLCITDPVVSCKFNRYNRQTELKIINLPTQVLTLIIRIENNKKQDFPSIP